MNDGRNELYDYDALSQLPQLKRGTLSDGQIPNPVWQEDFKFDPTGNWHDAPEVGRGYVTAVNSSETLVQNRAHNPANEITDITETVGPSWVTPVHDADGNMTTIPQPGSPTNSYNCTWDAWNRLVRVSTSAGTVAEYAYDGLNRRVSKTISSTTRHYYYTNRWQALALR